MCGFVGYINATDEAKKNEAVIRAMADRIVHRGPDQDDYYVDSDISLGFRRLSIIDLSGGSQPILNEDGSKVLLFNGEIYNFQPLREELLEKGHTFKTKTDSEVLLHGYEQWGKDMLVRLRGMFAFVIWDKNEKKLFGARDIFGIKPFFYYLNEGNFLFGSEIKAFLANPLFKKELNEERLPEYLCFEYLPDHETLFRHVYKMEPGAWFEWQNGEFTSERYFTPEYDIDETKTLEQWEQLIDETFKDSTQSPRHFRRRGRLLPFRRRGFKLCGARNGEAQRRENLFRRLCGRKIFRTFRRPGVCKNRRRAQLLEENHRRRIF